MSNIKAGDLVLIVGCDPEMHPICGPFLGLIRTVGYLFEDDCYRLEPPTIHTDGLQIAWASNHLKKIKPLDEPESITNDEELTA